MKHITLLVAAILLATASFTQSLSGRYVDPVFTDITVTSAVAFGSNTGVGGGTQTLLMDVYEPAGDTLAERPVVLVAFGGSFVAGNRGDVAEICEEFARRGYVAVAPDYRVGFFFPNALTTTLAVVRGMHDMKACVRFLRRSVVEQENPYGIDTTRIIAGGVSAGAISAIHATYLDSDAEMPPAIGGQAAQLGGAEGNSGNPGYSSSVLACLSFSGAIGDTAWVNAGDPPLFSIHEDGDNVVPYFTQEVSVVGIPTGLVASGSHDLHLRAQNVGLNNCLLTYDANSHVGYFNSDPAGTFAFTFARCAEVVLGGFENCGELLTSVPDAATEATLTLAPNPTNGVLRTFLPEAALLSVFDAQGRVVWQRSAPAGDAQLQLEDLQPGVYLLRSEGASVRTARFVKQ
ncbi:MAG: T9SS type A sorting domain-containing protein [Flavobacteriales bacterium]